MATNEAISVVIEDTDGNLHELLNNLIDFNRIRQGEEKVEEIIIHNRSGRNVNDISIQAVAHPTAQIGNAINTYLATLMGATSSGPWYNIITIPTMSVNGKVTLYVNWTVPASSMLGAAQFALEITGDVIL